MNLGVPSTAVTVLAAVALAGCGQRVAEGSQTELRGSQSSLVSSDDAELLNTERLDPKAMEALQVAAFDLSGDPQLPIAARGLGYDLMVLGRVVEFRKGPSSPDLPPGG